jgi:hypothetical protein
MRRACEAGKHYAMKPAVAALVYVYWDNPGNRARLKLRTAESRT